MFLSCLLLGAIADAGRRQTRVTVIVLGVSLLAAGIAGYAGFKYLSLAALDSVPAVPQLKPNAAQTVLGYYYRCASSGGDVAFGDGSVKYVGREQFAKLRHADSPDQTPEFISPVKVPTVDESTEIANERQGENAPRSVEAIQERIKHSNNLKQMAEGHFYSRPRDGLRVPLKPEHLSTYPAMSDELRKAIADGTYVWYFGWQPRVLYTAERTKALWYDFASWASVYVAGFGAGAMLAGLVLVRKQTKPALFPDGE